MLFSWPLRSIRFLLWDPSLWLVPPTTEFLAYCRLLSIHYTELFRDLCLFECLMQPNPIRNRGPLGRDDLSAGKGHLNLLPGSKILNSAFEIHALPRSRNVGQISGKEYSSDL